MRRQNVRSKSTARLALLHQAEHLLARLAADRDESRGEVGTALDRAQLEQLAPLARRSGPRGCGRRPRLPAAARSISSPSGRVAIMSASIRTITSAGWRSGAIVFASQGGDAGGRLDEADLGAEQLALLGGEPEVEQVDRLVVALQAQRVDHRDRAEEVAGVGRRSRRPLAVIGRRSAATEPVERVKTPSGRWLRAIQPSRSRAWIRARTSAPSAPPAGARESAARAPGSPASGPTRQPHQQARVDAVIHRLQPGLARQDVVHDVGLARRRRRRQRSARSSTSSGAPKPSGLIIRLSQAHDPLRRRPGSPGSR